MSRAQSRRRVLRPLAQITAGGCALGGCLVALLAMAMPPVPVVLDVATPSDSLQAIARHEKRIVAVGSKGTALESVDGGAHFERSSLPGRPALIDVTVCPDGRFYLLDFRSGLWSRPVSGRPAEPWVRGVLGTDEEGPPPRLLALCCDPTGTLWAVGEESTVLRSADAGATWARVLPDRSDRLLTAVGFADARRGRVLGEFGSYFESEDGGVSWRVGPAIPEDFYPHAAVFAADGRSWVVGNIGLVYRLDPGAEAWVAEQTGTRDAFYGAALVGSQVVAVGAGGRGRRRPLAGSAAVVRWRPLSGRVGSGVARDWRGVVALRDDSFLAVGNAGLLRVGPLATEPAAR